MADYRDELRAAHNRIAQLEAEREPKPPPKPRHGRALTIGLTIALLAFVAVFGTTALFFLRARPTTVVEAPVPLYLPPPADLTPILGFSWYAQPLVTPIFADIDVPADGKTEIVGLAWQAGHETAPLNVVALDRETGRARWHAGPYAAHWSSDRVHLLLVGQELVVSDSHETLHVLDLHTGKELRAPIELKTSPEHMCAVHDGTPRVLVNEGYDPSTTLAVDLATGETTKVGPKLACQNHYEDHACLPGATSQAPCRMPTEKKVDARIHGTPGLQKLWSTETLVAGDQRVVLGFRSDTAGETTEMAIGVDPSAKNVLWSQPLVPAEDSLDRHTKRGLAPLSILAHDHLYFLYESAKEPLPYRLVGRAASTGDVAFQVDVPGTAEGSYMVSLSEDSGQVLVIMDQTLYLFDGSTGALAKRISTF